MKKHDYVLTTFDNEYVDITAYGVNDIEKAPCVILVHGFKGFKDWGFGPYTAEYLVNSGFFVLTFNFSLNGIGRGTQEFTELDKFSKNTFSREIDELSSVIEAYKKNFFGSTKNKRISLIGHSRGGAICLLTAHKRSDIYSVVVWASVSKLDRYSERQKEQWRKKGFFEVLNQRTKQVMRISTSLLDDLEVYKNSSLNIEDAVRKLNVPLLIVHGEQDLAVPVKEGEQLYNWSNKSKTEFLRIKSTGHTFNIKHPFDGSNEKFESILKRTSEFLQK